MDYKQLNGLSLAYIGDAIYEIYIRKYLIDNGYTKVNDLHKKAVNYTSGKHQALVMEYLLNNDYLTEEEITIYKRGRNSHLNSNRKNIDLKDYLEATGFEAVLGYLHYSNASRLEEIIKISIEYLKEFEAI